MPVRFLGILFTLLISAPCVFAQELTLTAVRIEMQPIGENFIRNGGFETLGGSGLPVEWQWDRRNTDASVAVDNQVFHWGKRSLRFVSTTAYGANIYAGLTPTQSIAVTPGRPYTLSAYVRCDRGGSAWIGGGHGWQFRLWFPATGSSWRRIAMTFTPGTDDAAFSPRINLDAPVKVWVDDLKLEEGDRATPAWSVLDSGGPTIEFTGQPPASDRSGEVPVVQMESQAQSPSAEVQGDGSFDIAFTLLTPINLSDASMEIGFAPMLNGHAMPASLKVSLNVGQGAWRIDVHGRAFGVSQKERRLLVRLKSQGHEAAQSGVTLTFLSGANAAVRLRTLRNHLPELAVLLAKVRASGQDTAYPEVPFTVLTNFVSYVDQDLTGAAGRARPEVKRAISQLDELESMAARLREDLRRHLSGERYPAVPRWNGNERPLVKGSSFLAPDPLSTTARLKERPFFFTGYGHFGQVIADIEKFPGYGANIIQIEMGPSSIFPREGVVDAAPIEAMQKILVRAQKAGVAVALLISPHYFPDWLRAKYPDLQRKRDGFLQYSLYAPEGQELLQRFIRTVIPPLKDYPALQSIVLSNEPTNIEEPGPLQARAWNTWLEKRYGSLASLNSVWGAAYTNLDAIPLPDPFHPPAPSPLWMDWVLFNQEFFADWHARIAQTIHEIAPGLPVHAKVMTFTFVNEQAVRYGLDAYLFVKFSDINGNDSSNSAVYGPGEFAQNWQEEAMGYDLQRSVRDAPVFNSENHLIPDRETRAVPPTHIRAALWQGAVHGQSATAIWVWERTFDANADLAGDIMHRPACAEAVGVVNHDLNRAAPEVTALQQAPPQVLILQSVTASVWDGSAYGDCLNKLYTALEFTGLKAGFVEERQLESGVIPGAPFLFIPNITHLSDRAEATLRQYRGRLVLVGPSGVGDPHLLSRDAYDHLRSKPIDGIGMDFDYGKTSWHDLWRQALSLLSERNGVPAAHVVDKRGDPLWGVDCRTAISAKGLIVDLCNYRQGPQEILLAAPRRLSSAVDVLTGKPINFPLTLQPLEVKLLRISP